MSKPISALSPGAALLAAQGAHARATPDEIARLGKDLTCVGAEKAGNADGSIPALERQVAGRAAGVEFKGTGFHPVDPTPPKAPLRDHRGPTWPSTPSACRRAEGAVQALPATYRIAVYPSHRDFRFPEAVCKVASRMPPAPSWWTTARGDGASGGVLFPIPVGPRAAVERHHALPAWDRGAGLRQRLRAGRRQQNWGRVRSRNLARASSPAASGKTVGNRPTTSTRPCCPNATRAREHRHRVLNFAREPRQSWRYDPGTRRRAAVAGLRLRHALPGHRRLHRGGTRCALQRPRRSASTGRSSARRSCTCPTTPTGCT